MAMPHPLPLMIGGGLSYNSYLASLGPATWWKLDDPAGSTTVADSSGNGYTGTVNGGVTLGEPGPGTGGTSALFDGSTGYITTSYNTSYTALSIIAWLNLPTFAATNNPRIVNNNHVDASNTSPGYQVLVNGSYLPTGSTQGAPSANIGTGTSSYAAIYSPTAIIGKGWVMSALTYNGSTITLYQNGSSVSSTSYSGTISAGSNGAYIGAGVYLGDFWPGYLAQIAIFSTALTAQEVSKLYSLATA